MNAVAQQFDFRTSRAYPVIAPEMHDLGEDAATFDADDAALPETTAEIYRPEPFHMQADTVEPEAPASVALVTNAATTEPVDAEPEMDAVALEGVRAHNCALSLREMGRAAIAEADAQAAANPQKDSLFAKLRGKFAKR